MISWTPDSFIVLLDMSTRRVVMTPDHLRKNMQIYLGEKIYVGAPASDMEPLTFLAQETGEPGGACANPATKEDLPGAALKTDLWAVGIGLPGWVALAMGFMRGP